MLGVSVDADQLIAGKGCHLDLSLRAGVGWELGSAIVCAPCFFHSDCIPYAADTGDHGTVLNAFEETFFYRVEKGRAFRNGEHGIGHVFTFDIAFCLIPGAEVGDAVTV